MKIYVIVGAALALVLALSASHRWVYDSGRKAERADALSRSIELIRQRSQTNVQINSLDDAGLCAALGGRWVPDQGLCE